MNILIINHYAGSPEYGMEFRAYYLAKEWQKEGHRVHIVAGSFSHLRNSQPVPGQEIIDGIKYIWIKTMKYEGNSILRVLSIFQFVFKLTFFSKRIIDKFKPDVVISSSTYPLDIYPAYLIAKRSRTKLVFELHDMWPLSPMIIGGYSKNHPFIWIMQKAENFACRNCDCYISLLGNTKDYLIQHGLAKEKFFHIPNGYSVDDIHPGNIDLPDQHVQVLQKLKNDQNIIIGYAGGHAPSNALESFILAITKYANTPGIAFVLVGAGTQKGELIAMAQEKKQKNIFFLPPVSKASIPELLRNFDILYAGGVSSVLHYYGTSFNKIIDYMLAEKPIIFAVDEPNSIVEKVGCGVQVSAEDEKEIIKAIKYFATLSKEQRRVIGMKGRVYAIKELNYTALAKKFIRAVENS